MVTGKISRSGVSPVMGVVLAGGKSSRMGVDKAGLVFRGQTLLAYQYQKIASVLGCENVVVSGNYPLFRHVLDRDMGTGPLGGIASVVRTFFQAEYFLFLPVDMPYMAEESLRRLVQAATSDLQFNCWKYTKSEMPFVLRNTQGVDSILNEVCSETRHRRSVRNFCGLMGCCDIEYGELRKEEFLNANTMKEWNGVLNEYTDEQFRDPLSIGSGRG